MSFSRQTQRQLQRQYEQMPLAQRLMLAAHTRIHESGLSRFRRFWLHYAVWSRHGYGPVRSLRLAWEFAHLPTEKPRDPAPL
jgi:hypothetical protein